MGPDSPGGGDGESSSAAYPTTRLARLGGVAARHPWRFVLVWVVITVAAFAVAVGGVTGESLFQRLHSGAPSAPSEAQTGQDLVEDNQASSDSLTLQVDRREPGRPGRRRGGDDRDPEPGRGPGRHAR